MTTLELAILSVPLLALVAGVVRDLRADERRARWRTYVDEREARYRQDGWR